MDAAARQRRTGRHPSPVHSIAASIRRRGGLAATHELYSDGYDRHHVARAVRARVIVRVRQGWFVLPGIHPSIQEALRVGGRLSCVSALALYDAWKAPGIDLHVAVATNSARLRTRNNPRRRLVDLTNSRVRVHWGPEGDGTRLMLGPLACLNDLIVCQPPDIAFAVVESLQHERPTPPLAWAAFVDSVPVIHRPMLRLVDGICESGAEGLFWFRMQPFGLSFRRQVSIAGVGRVDFMIGKRLIVEVDGATYHTDPEQFEKDRHRDAVLSRLGYRVLRFSYLQVTENWPEVEAAVIGAILRGDHR